MGLELAKDFGCGGDLPVAFRVAQVKALGELFGEEGARGYRLRAEPLALQRDTIGLGRALFKGECRLIHSVVEPGHENVPLFLVGQAQG